MLSARGRRADVIYVGRNRLAGARANLIQTLHTSAAFAQLGLVTRLYLPAWPRGLDVAGKLRGVGVAESGIDLRPSRLLHPRWRYHPFIAWHRRELCEVGERGLVYTRLPAISAALAGWGGRGVRHVLEVHETRPMLEDGLMRSVMEAHRRGVLHHLIALTRADARVLVEHGAEPTRVTTVPSGVDTAAFATVRPLDPARLDRPRIVYLGRVTDDRGLAVFREMVKRKGYDITAVGDAPEGAAMEDANGGGDGVKRVPGVPHREVPGWYGRCELALMPYQEGLRHAASISPIKLFEAMAAGRPIVASDLPTIREVVRDGETGLLVEPGNVEAWIAAVERLRSDPALAVRLASAARAEAGRYDWRERARRIVEAAGVGAGRAA